jgi:hypothetical protein
MLAPLGATVAVVFPVVVFPAVASDDVLVSLPPMLAPPGATVAVVLSVVVVAAPPASIAGLPVVVAFCGKQADCAAVTLVSLAVGPNDAPPGAGVAAVSLPPPPPVACTGLIGAAAMNVSISKTAGIAIVVMNLGYSIAVFFLSGLLLLIAL